MSIEGILSTFRLFSTRFDTDASDRLSYFFTSNLLVALSALTAVRTFDSSPLQCMTPSSFPYSWNTIVYVPYVLPSLSMLHHSIVGKLRFRAGQKQSKTNDFSEISWNLSKSILTVTMVMIETFLGMARYLSPRNDDDWSDRLNYLYTPNILLAFSVLISFKQFGGRPIECMFPNKFPGSWEQYAENFCWSQDVYYVEQKQHVELLKEEERYTKERELSYYQWVPFFLILQAAFFRAPSLLWKYFSNHSGIRIHEVVTRARDAANVEEDVKDRNVSVLVRHLTNALRFHRRIEKKGVVVHKTLTCLNFQYSSAFISFIYLFTKLIYLGNVVLQLWLMNFFLKTNKHEWYGWGVISDLINGVQWENSGFFPRAAVCDFEVRQIANIQKYSVQCVLVINIFNEKIFLLLWFWYLLILFCSFVTFFHWFFLLVFPCFSRWFIAQHLELSNLEGFDPTNRKGRSEVKKFVESYLHRDGVFVLRMVSSHAGIIFGTDLIMALWKAFYGIEDNATVSRSPTPQKQSSDESLRHRKKENKVNLLLDKNGDITTTLIPIDDDKSRKSSTSDDN